MVLLLFSFCVPRLSLMGCLVDLVVSTASAVFALPIGPIEPVVFLRQEHYETAVAKMGLGKDRVVHVRFTPC